MKTHNFSKNIIFFVILIISVSSLSQEEEGVPKPPEIVVEKPKILEEIIKVVGTGLGLSKQAKKKKEASRIDRNSLHQSELEYYKNNPYSFNDIEDTMHVAQIDSLQYTVMGWYPYWVKETYDYYSYNLLSDISYFSYELNPNTGGAKNIHDWEDTFMIDIAKYHRCNVHLTLSSYGKFNNIQFLTNNKAQKKSIRSLIQFIKYRNATGVTIDMQPITPLISTKFTQYINTLATALHQQNLRLNLVLPPVFQPNTFDIANLTPNVDLFIIMGYGYASSKGKKAGPLSPLFPNKDIGYHALSTSIDTYLEQGVPKNKCIVSLPYLGSQWQVKKPEIPTSRSKHLGYFPIRFTSNFLNMYSFKLDPLSYTLFSSYPNKKGRFSQTWVDTKETLKAKYQMIIDKKLKGVAIWALGYDNGTTEFWELIEETFAVPVIENEKEIAPQEVFIEEQKRDSLEIQLIEKIETISEKVTQITDFNATLLQEDTLSVSNEPLKKEVFGWHPHWVKEKYKSYNFKLLTTLAYFSYEIDAKTGHYQTIHDWATTKVIDSAHAKGTKVHLTATNFGRKNNIAFLKNPNAQKHFIDEIIKQVEKRAADGINLNFEDIPKAVSEHFTNFVIKLSERLQIEGLEFSMAIPANDFEYIYDFKTLVNFVDYFVMMGYNYHYKNSPTVGPNAPLKSSAKWGKLSIEHSVNTYFSRGIPPIQLIVAYPYYGIESNASSIKIPSKNKGYIKEWTYSNIRNQFKKPPIIDAESTSAYYVIPNPSNDKIRQLWFDNEESFAIKCDWVNQKKLRGVGIWALGYDHGNNELWTVLNQKFAKDPSETTLTPMHSGESLRSKIMHILNDIDLNSTTIIIILSLLLAVLLLGFAFALLNGQVVDVVFNYRLFKAGLIILFLIALLSILKLKTLISNLEMLFFCGGVVGIVITFIIHKRMVASNKNKP